MLRIWCKLSGNTLSSLSFVDNFVGVAETGLMLLSWIVLPIIIVNVGI